jgi:hypothetical protein
MRLALCAVGVLAMTGCGEGKSPAERAAEDARAIAQVEAINSGKPPVVPVTLEPLAETDLATARRSGAGCGFMIERGDRPLVFSGASRAVARIEGKAVSFASDPGGAKLPLETWGHYVGKQQSLVIELLGETSAAPGQSDQRWPARLTLRDANNQIVSTTGGTLVCG